MDAAIAITGMGAVTAQGVGVRATWEGVAAGREALGVWRGVGAEHPLAHVKVACCPDLPRPDDLPMRLWGGLSRTQQLACVAADEALRQAGLPRRLGRTFGTAGLFVATTVCGMDQNERYYAAYRVHKDGADAGLLRRLQAYEVGALLARRHRTAEGMGLRGVYLSTCVGSALAIAAACDAIASGRCAVAMAGGSEGFCRVVLSGFSALKVVAAEGCRPFDRDRPGITVGEGAGILVLERVVAARRRGAIPLAYVRGCGITCDGHHLTAPDPEGVQAVRAIRDALHRAGVPPEEIDYINAHGTGTRDNDAMEAKALRSVFAPCGVPPVSSTKRCTGHTFAAAGVIEAVLCVEAMGAGVLPVNAGSVAADAALDVPVVRGASRRGAVRSVLSTNFAFGGNNTALVLSREPGAEPGAAPAPPPMLAVHGVGVVTDAYTSVGELAADGRAGAVAAAEILDPATITQHDVLAQLAIRAAHQAWMMAGQPVLGGDDVGLVFVTGWGTIDATVSYLESMLESDGRYASPRHFARSVYSSVAAVLAIHFGVHGPCETLCFEESPVAGGMGEARRLLAARRCARVLVVWADQAAEIATDLARRAVEELGRLEYARYRSAGGLGYGAAAVMVSARGPWRVDPVKMAGPAEALRTERGALRGGPFATDDALAFAARVLCAYSAE